MRIRRALVALAIVALVGVATPTGAEEVTPGLLEARAEAEQLVADIDAAQTRLGELESEVAALEAEQATLEEQQDALRDELSELAVDRYVHGGLSTGYDPDPNRRLRADALSDIVGGTRRDALDEYRGIDARLDENRAALDDLLAEQEEVVATLGARQAALADELARLEQLEIERVAEERRRAEQAARDAADAAARRAAEERAAELAREEQARRAGEDVADSPAPSPTVPDTPDDPIVTPPPGGGMVCPVPGAVFRNGFGDPRPGGRSHEGIDMVAATGTPIVAPVSGVVAHGADPLGGNNFTLQGSDGRFYYGAHLSGYGQAGSVAAGTVVGYVGETGHAFGAHLHIEIHVGGVPINPYGDLVAAC
jgi:murein DD-endopeptidase MepM/ murein hydrolase activator NlpD